MKKTYSINPLDEIELIYKRKKYVLKFGADAVFRLQTEFDIAELINNSSVTNLCATLVYCASINQNGDMTIDKAKELVSEMNIEVITGIITDFQSNMGITKNEELKELQKKTMETFVRKLCKQK